MNLRKLKIERDEFDVVKSHSCRGGSFDSLGLAAVVFWFDEPWNTTKDGGVRLVRNFV